MKVRQARTAGFCMGVRRAVELVLEEASRRPGPIVTYGPLIHNNQVLELLANKGVRVVDDLGQLTGDETAVIRAHGVPPAIKAHLRKAAGRVVDATCPRVLRVQALIRRYTALGHTALIVGDPDHAEVRGLIGHARGQGVVVSQAGQAARLDDYNRVILVAQTTQSNAVFEQIAQEVKNLWPQALIFNTICPATHERQIEVKELARQVEAVVVVGGSFSANTRRLAQIAAQNQTQTFHVETEAELDLAAIGRLRSVGVTAGASTPNWLIRKVVEELRGLPALGQNRWRSAAFRVFRFLLKSNTLVALGGAGLALAGGLALGLKISASLLAVPFFYLYAMHTLNHFLDREATAYNDPERLRFYAKHRVFLVATSSVATLLGLLLSARLGPASFISLLTLSALGLLYSIRIVPARWQERLGYAKLKDFPGSKPLGIALAWGLVLGLWPPLAFGQGWFDGWLVFLLAAGLAFVRSAIFDVLDIQGDLLVGKETLAIHLGEGKTLRLLQGISLGLVLLAGLAVLAGLPLLAGIAFATAAAGLGSIILAYQAKRLLPGMGLEGLVEASFLVAGGLAALSLFVR